MSKLDNVNMTDIGDAIRLGCRTMQNVFNADDNHVPFTRSTVRPDVALSYSSYGSDAHIPGRHLNAMLNAEDVAGVGLDEAAVEKHRAAVLLSYSGPVPLPLNREAIGGAPVNFCPHNLREARKPFIGPSRRDSGAYDLTQMIGPSDAVVRGDELWFYYTALKYRAAGTNIVDGKWLRRPGYDADTGAICLAVLRRDGFISLDAGDTKGTILTAPFTAAGGKLFINADAFNGELRVEVLGENGKVLAVSAPIKGDLLRGEVKWQKGSIADIKGKAVSLRFTLRNASLYSYWLQ